MVEVMDVVEPLVEVVVVIELELGVGLSTAWQPLTHLAADRPCLYTPEVTPNFR